MIGKLVFATSSRKSWLAAGPELIALAIWLPLVLLIWFWLPKGYTIAFVAKFILIIGTIAVLGALVSRFTLKETIVFTVDQIPGNLLHPQPVWRSGDPGDLNPTRLEVDHDEHEVPNETVYRMLLLLIDKRLVLAESPDTNRWRDLRLWASVLITVQLGLYVLFA